MPDDLTTMLDALVDDAQTAARLGTSADIWRRARRQSRRAFLGAGALTVAAAACVVAVAPTLTGSQYVMLNMVSGSSQLGTFLAPAGNGGWTDVTEMLYFLPSVQDAATFYGRLRPDLHSCLTGTSGFDGTKVSAGFTAQTANGFGWYQRFQFQPGSTTSPRMAATYILAARQGNIVAVFSADATWASGNQGPAYDTSGDQRALDSLVTHLAAYADPTS